MADLCLADKAANCPRCQEPCQVPQYEQASEASSATHKLSREELAETLISGFQGPIKRSRPTITYRIAILIVALVMVLLPVAYVVLIGLVGYGVYAHATHLSELWDTELYDVSQISLALFYYGPIVAGCLLIFSMIKPLFFRSDENTRSRSLIRKSEPLLFAFVDRICESIGTSIPTRIDIDCRVNASASFRRGFLSLFSHDLVLTIGAPLVAGLNTREFAGILAHEFGHFSQHAGMRLSYIIRATNYWLSRLFEQRDAVDQWLSNSTKSAGILFGWVFHIPMLFVWITRRILWVMMQVGNIFGSYLLRQMEFDADRYETRLVGSEVFVETVTKMQILAIANEAAITDLKELYQDGQLGNNLPKHIVSKTSQLPDSLIQDVFIALEDNPTGWFDNHPSDCDRISNALREDCEGVFQIELPASVLFNNFEAQAENTTWEFYREKYGDLIKRKQLHPLDTLNEKLDKKEASRRALDRFFQDQWSVSLPLVLPYEYSQPPEEIEETLEKLFSARQSMLDELNFASTQFEHLGDAHLQLIKAERTRYFGRTKFNLTQDGQPLPKDYELAAQNMKDAASKAHLYARQSLEQYIDFSSQRVGAALQLLHVPQIAQQIPNAESLLEQTAGLLEGYSALSSQIESLYRLVRLHKVNSELTPYRAKHGNDQQLKSTVESIGRQAFPVLQQLRNYWNRWPYPYDHEEHQLTLGKYLIPELPISDDFWNILECCHNAVENSLPLYIRLLSDLTFIAESVETAVGLPQLPEPDYQEE